MYRASRSRRYRSRTKEGFQESIQPWRSLLGVVELLHVLSFETSLLFPLRLASALAGTEVNSPESSGVVDEADDCRWDVAGLPWKETRTNFNVMRSMA